MTELTVAICTFNRFDMLSSLINNFFQQPTNKSIYEIIIVDNSTDSDCIAAIKSMPIPSNARVIRSDIPGLSRARNVALRSARAKNISYIDDDALPCISWVDHIIQTFRDYPNAAVVGGPILPIWPIDKPNWLSDNTQGALTILDKGNEIRLLDVHEHLYGANISFRCDILMEIGGFSENLGRNGNGNLLSNEEIVVQEDIRKAHKEIIYNPNIIVSHHVHRDRISQGYLRSRYAWQAVSDCLSWGSPKDPLYHLNNFVEQSKQAGLDKNIEDILCETNEPDTFDAQIKCIMSLINSLLSTNCNISQSSEIFRDRLNSSSHVDLQFSNSSSFYQKFDNFTLKENSLLVIDSIDGHNFLYSTISDINNSIFIQIPYSNLWNLSDPNQINELFSFMKKIFFNACLNNSKILMLTIDPWLSDNLYREFKILLNAFDVEIRGILHREFDSDLFYEKLSCVSSHLSNIYVFSHKMMENLNNKIVGRKFMDIPLPVAFEHLENKCEVNKLKERMKIPLDKCVVSLLGEIRSDKSIDRFLNFINKIPDGLSQKLFIIVSGKGSINDRNIIGQCLKKKNIQNLINILDSSDGYRVVPDDVFKKYFIISDIGLLMNTSIKGNHVSANLSKYVYYGAHVLVANSTYTSGIVEDNNLGEIFDINSETDMIDKFINLLNKISKSDSSSQKYLLEYKKCISNEAFIRSLKIS